MAENKTKPTDADVDAFIDAVDNDRRREEARTVLALMREITGEDPAMWGPSMVGFGSVHYRYDSGREGDMFAAGFSPRKTALTVYLAAGFDGREELLERLGPHTTGKGCLYLKRLDAVDLDILRALVESSYRHAVTVVDAPKGGG
ncbi:MAG TPA: DUF1801 domain-containing protein [Microthrixaceae bacterium]|nr:DUF1801 domain-containing protein [Microthrixaceae bacterium]